MNASANLILDSLEGRTFIIGREGHIYISDPAVGKQHAEITIVEGKIRIRDLDSANGIYIVKDNKPIRIKEDYVEPDQTIAIGSETHTVQNLLAIVESFSG